MVANAHSGSRCDTVSRIRSYKLTNETSELYPALQEIGEYCKTLYEFYFANIPGRRLSDIIVMPRKVCGENVWGQEVCLERASGK